MNTKLQANIGLGQAIAYFSSIGWTVSIPLSESQRYDLVVDDGARLFRVEVKTTRKVKPSGSYELQLATSGGNQSWNGVCKTIDSDECDIVFAHVIGGRSYIFPSVFCSGKRTLTLSSDKDCYMVNGSDCAGDAIVSVKHESSD